MPRHVASWAKGYILGCSLFLLACEGTVSDIVGQPSNGTDEDMGGAGGFDNAINGGGGVAATGGEAQGGAGGNANVAGGGQGGNAATGGSTGMPGSGGVPPGPAGSVEMFVAVGFGGRRLMSCDRGRTWIAEQMVAPVSQDNEHQSYTPKGLAYGDGTFIFLSGWGTASTTWATSDGVTWSQKKHDSGFTGIGFDKGAFIAVGGSVAKSTDKGATWTRLNVPATSLTRDGAAFDGVWAAGADAQVATLRAGGTNWVPLSGCNGPRHGGIGTAGGFVAGLGLMVSVGEDGDTCGISIATGSALGSGKTPAPIRGKPTFVGDALWVASGDKLHTSTDGVRWASRALPTGVRFDLVARTASGTYAAADSPGRAFYFSDDGQRWTKAQAPSSGKLAFLLGGAGSPSKQCPLP